MAFGQLACHLEPRDRRFEVEPGLLVQSLCAGDQFSELDIDFVAGRGKRDGVAAIARRKNKRASIERFGDTGLSGLKAATVTEQVGDQQAGIR